MSEVESRGRTERERPRSAGERGKLHKRSAEANSLGRYESPAIKKRFTPEAAERENLISSRQEINRAVWFSA